MHARRDLLSPLIQISAKDDEEYHVLLNKWLRVKDQNLRLEDMAQKQNELLEEVLEELAAVKEKNESLEQEVSKLREVAIGQRESKDAGT